MANKQDSLTTVFLKLPSNLAASGDGKQPPPLSSPLCVKEHHMNNITIITMLVLIIVYVSSVNADGMPPLPYYDNGACPFECCVYGAWKSNEEVKAYKEPKNDAPIVFAINKDEKVEAITGFVVTHKVGVTKVIKPIKMGYLQGSDDNEEKLNLKPGELVYTLHYAGEGYDLFWYKGKIYSDQISINKPDRDPPPPHLLLQVISRPDADWWVKIKNNKGQIGWIKNPPYFEGSDACS